MHIYAYVMWYKPQKSQPPQAADAYDRCGLFIPWATCILYIVLRSVRTNWMNKFM